MRRMRDECPLRRLPCARVRNDRQFDGGRSALHSHARKIRRLTLTYDSKPGGTWRGDDSVWSRSARHNRVGRCGRRTNEEDSCVRSRNGDEGSRRILPEERYRARHSRRTGKNPRANAYAETIRVSSITRAFRVISARTSLSEARVGANVGVAAWLPRREPGVSVRFSPTLLPDEVWNPQRYKQRNREHDCSRKSHG